MVSQSLTIRQPSPKIGWYSESRCRRLMSMARSDKVIQNVAVRAIGPTPQGVLHLRIHHRLLIRPILGGRQVVLFPYLHVVQEGCDFGLNTVRYKATIHGCMSSVRRPESGTTRRPSTWKSSRLSPSSSLRRKI